MISGAFDVAVIGGGSAGLAAAVTSARAGANTLLLERHGYLGGMGTASLVHTFCGLYLLRNDPGAVIANPGFASEMAERMMEATGIGPQRMGRVDVLPQHPAEFVRIADEFVIAESNLKLQLHTEVVGIERSESDWRLKIAGRGGERAMQAKQLIDASGDAVAADFLKADSTMIECPRLQRPAYIFGIHGLPDFGDAARLLTSGWLVDGVRNERISKHSLGLSFRASGRAGEVFGSLDLTGGESESDYDPLDARCLTGLEIQGREIANQVVNFLRKNLEIWRQAYISHWPLRAGVRESRRWIGEAILTGADLLEGKRFEDEIALATWPMEFRETAKGPKLRYPIDNRPAGIPLGCLQPKGIENLHVAGRCISVDHDAQASIRVMGTCFATGEAAGKAAVGNL